MCRRKLYGGAYAIGSKNSLIELIKYLCGKYGIKEIYGHGELNSTNCPGTNYPIDEIRRETRLEFYKNKVRLSWLFN
ncbi:putative N-acetylmuramoyl-L-alanine amidase [Clostridium tetani]|nr:putative N-acetylmuramoyl-L-alanine amidase [Clostridium tetani]